MGQDTTKDLAIHRSESSVLIIIMTIKDYDTASALEYLQMLK